jgi:hypothetical protein
VERYGLGGIDLDFEHSASHNSFILRTANKPTDSPERELEALIEEARRRARRRRLGYAALVVLLAGVALALTRGDGDGGGGPPAGAPTPPEPTPSYAAHGIEAQLQPGWHAARKVLTPRLLNPSERFSLGTLAMRRSGDRCAQLPGSAYAEMRPTDGMITVMERGGRAGGFPPRPGGFDLSSGSGLFECVPARLRAQPIAFRESGRNLEVMVVLGARGPRSEAEAILNSLRVSPRP